MSLLAMTIAAHPDAPPDALAAVLNDPGRDPGDTHLNAHLLAHPAAPDGSGRRVGANLTCALTSPLLTDTTRARILRNADGPELIDYLCDNADAHPAVHTELHNRLTHVNRNRCRGYTTLLLHPTTPDHVHLGAVYHHLSSLSASAGIPYRLATVLTHATHHPDHLSALAAAARTAPPGNEWVADELARYAHAHASGTNAAALRLSELTHAARTSGDWVSCVSACADPATALAALTRAPTPATIAALETSPDLAASPAVYWARTRTITDATLTRGGSTAAALVAAELDTLDTSRTYTRRDAALHAAAHGTATSHSLATLSMAPPHAAPDHVATIARAVRAAAEHRTHDWGPNDAARLAVHPHTPARERHRLAAAITAGTNFVCRLRGEDAIVRIARSAGNDLGAAILGTTVPELVTATLGNLCLRDNLAHHLAATIGPHLNNWPALTAALALEPTFTGTLAELIDTATAITR